MNVFKLTFILFNRKESMSFELRSNSLMTALDHAIALLDIEHRISPKNISCVIIFTEEI